MNDIYRYNLPFGQRMLRDGELIYLSLLTIALFFSFLMNTTFMTYIPVKYFNYILYMIIAALGYKVLILDHYQISQLIPIGLIMMLSCVSWRFTKITSLMVMVTFILSAKNVSFKKILTVYFIENVSLLLTIFVYSLTGVISNLVYVRNGVNRYSLGVSYTTDLAAYFFYLALIFGYLYYGGIRLRVYSLIVAGLSVSCYLITRTRLDTILILMIVPMIFVAHFADAGSRFAKRIASLLWFQPITLPYLYMLLNLYYSPSNHIFARLDRVLSGRLSLGNTALNKYGITIFGQHVIENGWGSTKGRLMFKYHPEKYFYIDSSFIRLFVIYGAILGVFIIGTMLYLSIESTKLRFYLMPSILAIITLSSLIDQHLTELTYNPFLIALLAYNFNFPYGGQQNEKNSTLED